MVRAVSDGYVQAREDVQTLLKGKALPDASSSTLIRAFTAQVAARSTAPTFGDVAREQFKLANFAPKTVQKAKRAHKLFVSVVGNKPVDMITRRDVHRFLDLVAVQEVGKASGAARRISRTTVQSYLSQVSSPISFSIGRGWRDGPNPAADIDLKHWVGPSDSALVPAKRRFEVAELNMLFAHPWFVGCSSATQSYRSGTHILDDMRYWAPVLALYTGARAAELGGLKLTEVRLGSSTPHILIQPNEFRRIKSGRPRTVPVLDALLELGFDQYVEGIAATGSDRLFPDWDCPKARGPSAENDLSRWANGKWIRAFNRTIIPEVFGRSPNAIRSAITFHSFRGAFKKLLIDHGDAKKANAIIGHVQDDLDRAYIGHFSADELWSEFRAANFRGIVVPGR